MLVKKKGGFTIEKKVIYLCAFIMIFVPMNSFASEVPSVSYNSVEWQKMCQNDIAEYDSKLNAIDAELVNNVNAFIAENQELSLVQNDINRSEMGAISNEDFLQAFLQAYPEYIGMENQISNDIEILRFNPVVEAVRAFFSANGYALSLDLFNHSLTNKVHLL